MGRSEHQEQVVLVSMVREFYPSVILAAVPNGGLRDPRVAAKLKAEGVLAGFPDLVLMEPRGRWHGAVIEMKREAGKGPTKKQHEILMSLKNRGFFVIVGRGARAAFRQVEEYLQLPSESRIVSARMELR